MHELLQQHRRLLRDLATLERYSIERASSSADRLQELRVLLPEFIAELSRHFDAEAASSLHLKLEQNSHRLKELERLDAEHPLLLNAFRAVLEGVETANPDLAAIGAALEAAASEFRRHEAEEDVLFSLIE